MRFPVIHSISFLIQASGEQEDLDRAVNIIHMAINDLDQAVLASMSDNLKPSINDSIKV